MKSTIKLDVMSDITIEPAGREVAVSLRVGGVVLRRVVLTPDQVGALSFGLEQAAAKAGMVPPAQLL
jgi:hypothetical protein